MGFWNVVVYVGIAMAVVVAVWVVRFSWRFLHGKEELDAGGSWGRQLEERPPPERGRRA